MGVYDTVMVPCPQCGEKAEFQSKSGECILLEVELEDCPYDILGDVNRHSPYTCSKCETVFEVHIDSKTCIYSFRNK
jgi:endogenous inhibitor of DNA gyrase (YacG/DUF329 family)